MDFHIDVKDCERAFINELDYLFSAHYVYSENISSCLKAGANINCYYKEFTPISIAVTAGSPEVVDLFYNHGANINMSNLDGSTPLTLAIQLFRLDTIKQLIRLGANPCKPNAEGNTPLSLAVDLGHIDIMEWLLDHGAQYTIQTAFLTTIKCENARIIKCLIRRGANVNFIYKKNSSTTPLFEAINTKNLEVVETLLRNEADVNLKGYSGTTPLIYCIEHDVFSIAKKLIEKGADVNEHSPLTKCIEKSNFKVAKILVKRGADVNKFISNERTPLTASIVHAESFLITKYLIDEGADTNLVDGKNESPLCAAAKMSNFSIFKFLIKSGASVEVVKRELEEVLDQNDDFRAYFTVHHEPRRTQLFDNSNLSGISTAYTESCHEEA